MSSDGALYNQAVGIASLRSDCKRRAQWNRDVVLVAWRGPDAGCVSEADSQLRPKRSPTGVSADGTLRSRKFEDALIRNPRKQRGKR